MILCLALGRSPRRGLGTAFSLQMYTGKGTMSARSFNPESDDEDGGQPEARNDGEVLISLALKVRKKRMCNHHRRRRNVPHPSNEYGLR